MAPEIPLEHLRIILEILDEYPATLKYEVYKAIAEKERALGNHSG